MYAPYFGLSREPFSLAPDPRFLYMSERHREALAHLLYGVRGGGGFVLLTGEIGAGKTTVTRCFLEQLPAHCLVAYIFNPCLSAIELLQAVCAEFGIARLPLRATVREHVEALNSFLLQAHAEGRHALLVIDEAQALPPPLLEQLRLLTNLETAERKLLQIMLIGQPELRDIIDGPGLEQLAQRVVARYHLGPLSAGETQHYVQHRLQVAGPHTAMPFEPQALKRLHKLSGGVPRRINLLADRAMLGAYGRRKRQIDAAMVLQAAREVFDPRGRKARRQRERWLAVSLGVLVAAGIGLAAWGWLRAVDAPAGDLASAASAASTPSAVLANAAASGASGASRTGAAAPGPASPGLAALPSAAGPAAAAAAAPLAPTAPSDDPGALLAAAHVDESLAWRELALRWNVAIGEGEPCVVAARAQMACYRSASGGLPQLRALARPALLALRRDGGLRVHAVLVGLDDKSATLQVGRQRFEMSLPALAAVWRGEFATFWRTPPGWRAGAEGAPPASVRAWVDQRLLKDAAAATPQDAAAFRERVLAFQTAQGLPADGRVGPLTLMQLSRLSGVDEPRLADAGSR